MKADFAAATLVGILLSIIGLDVRAATPVNATVALPHTDVLPGVPFELVVTYTNVTNKPVTVGGARATLVVTFASGETVVLDKADVNDQWDLAPAVPLRLAPGESVQQPASWATGSIPNWFRYPSFSGPGTYGIALELRLVDEDDEPLATVRTPPVTLTRTIGHGIDAELWNKMQAMSRGRWSDISFQAAKEGAVLAREIRQLHPASGYYPYVLALDALRRPNGGEIGALLEASQRFSSSPAYPYLLKAAADSARYEARKAERARDAAAIAKYWTLAQSSYRAAVATKNVAVRAGAEQGLRDVTRGLERNTKPVR